MNEIVDIVENKLYSFHDEIGIPAKFAHHITDKNTRHSYCESYTFLLEKFKNKPVFLLEIGCHYGGSLFIWHEFLNQSVLYGIDKNRPNGFIKKFLGIRLHFFKEDAYTEEVRNNVIGHLYNKFNHKFFDVIIDDGPHTLDSQIKALELYLPSLKDGGIFIIEDIQQIDHIDTLSDIANSVCNSINVSYIDLRENKGTYDDILFIVEKI